ncbi:uncharacterized protein N7482_008474 [Penicillium canariense]|uniref:Uncharacterized protein n=1 Tax=Penicillium canariense TaxID=189055 RepID=A0A9W9HVU4_9EURO|nr:uncharacterized protein N7482_008474 [Penicillium canariense]KAJ5157374.1 hypothetical protein N7482_008474 [Penicillium canariense]
MNSQIISANPRENPSGLHILQPMPATAMDNQDNGEEEDRWARQKGNPESGVGGMGGMREGKAIDITAKSGGGRLPKRALA